jgi:uncharacterized protein (TIGR02145 family)
MKTNSYAFIIAGLFYFGSVIAQNALTETGTLIDSRDGKTYKTITIDGQTWMAENLNFEIKENSWCYENKDSNCIIYGRLYNWNAAMNSCPSGWHLPSDQEWNILEKSIGIPDTDLDIVGYQGTNQGTSLKSGGNSGFNVVMGGFRLWWDGTFHYLGSYSDFWTSTESDKDEAWLRDFSAYENSIYRNRLDKKYGNSVRCIKDQN